jgi:phytase-like protein
MNRCCTLLFAPFVFAACQAPAIDDPVAVTAQAATTPGIKLIAVGSLPGTVGDRARQTSAALENGVAGDLLGGIGSGLAYAGWGRFLAVPDRGPNAQPYDSAVDDTASYINRFQTIHMQLRPSTGEATLPFTLTPKLEETTLLYSRTPLVYGTGAGLAVGAGAPALNRHHAYYFTGRSDNFDPTQPSSDPADARLDPESIRVSNDGLTVYVSDEYGPFVYQFSRLTGERLRTFALPPEFAVAHLSPRGDDEIAGNTAGRVANKGMEGLAISPDGRTLFGAMQSPLIQDGGTNGRFTRIVTIDVRSGETHQYAHELTNIGTAAKPKYPTVSEIVAINGHELVVDERDGKGRGDDSKAAYKMLYRIDLTGATEVGGIFGDANLAGKAVTKTPLVDVLGALVAAGFAPQDVPAKIEGLAFGPDLFIDGVVEHTLWIANDNDFIGHIVDTGHPAGIDNPNQFFVFAVDDSALPDFVHQRLWALF